MAEIRDFSSRRPVTNQNNYNKKINQHKFFKASRIGSFLLIIACVAIAIIIWQSNRVYTEYIVKTEADFSVAGNAESVMLGSTVFSYSMDGANCINTDGAQVWNQMYQMQKPIIDVCQNVVAIGDYNGNKVYVMDDTSVLGSFSTGLPIKEICVSANGYVVAVLEDTDVTWIYLYDTKGEELAHYKTTMEISGYPLSVDLSDDATLVAISYLFMDKDAFSTNVAFYNFGEVGSNYQNNLVSGYTYNTYGKIIPTIKFTNEAESYAVGTDAVISYESDQIPKQSAATLLDDEIISVFFGKTNVGLVFLDDESESVYRLEIYDVDGNRQCVHPFDMKYKEIILEEDRFTIYNEEVCQIYTMRNTLKFETTFTEPVIKFRMDEGRISGTLVTSDKIYTIGLN